MPTDASNATILELSADSLPQFHAVVRMKLKLFRNHFVNRLPRSRGTGQTVPLLYTASQRQNLTRDFWERRKIQKSYMVPLIQSLNCNSFMWRFYAIPSPPGRICVFHPFVLSLGNNQDNFQEQHYPAGAR